MSEAKVLVHSESVTHSGGKQQRTQQLVTVRDGKQYFAGVPLTGEGDDEMVKAASAALAQFVHDGCAPESHSWYQDPDRHTYRCHGCQVSFPVDSIPQAMHALLMNPPRHVKY